MPIMAPTVLVVGMNFLSILVLQKESLCSPAVQDASISSGNRISESVRDNSAPPPYEESESRILQEKVYRTEEKAPIRPLNNKSCSTTKNQSSPTGSAKTDDNGVLRW